jgi:hypothetical protein
VFSDEGFWVLGFEVGVWGVEVEAWGTSELDEVVVIEGGCHDRVGHREVQFLSCVKLV